MDWNPDRTMAAAALAWGAYEAIRGAVERRANRKQTERMARLIASRDLSDFAAAERILARPEKPKDEEPRKPGTYDEMFASPRPRKAEGSRM